MHLIGYGPKDLFVLRCNGFLYKYGGWRQTWNYFVFVPTKHKHNSWCQEWDNNILGPWRYSSVWATSLKISKLIMKLDQMCQSPTWQTGMLWHYSLSDSDYPEWTMIFTWIYSTYRHWVITRINCHQWIFVIYACLKIALDNTTCQLQLLLFPTWRWLIAKSDYAC